MRVTRPGEQLEVAHQLDGHVFGCGIENSMRWPGFRVSCAGRSAGVARCNAGGGMTIALSMQARPGFATPSPA